MAAACADGLFTSLARRVALGVEGECSLAALLDFAYSGLRPPLVPFRRLEESPLSDRARDDDSSGSEPPALEAPEEEEVAW